MSTISSTAGMAPLRTEAAQRSAGLATRPEAGQALGQILVPV